MQHQEALPYERIHEFVRQLRAHDGIGSEPLEWLILTATRTSETLLANWTEIDLRAEVWTQLSETTCGCVISELSRAYHKFCKNLRGEEHCWRAMWGHTLAGRAGNLFGRED